MLDTKGYKYTLRMCNTYCFSTAAVVVRMRINVKLHILSVMRATLYVTAVF